ncbi:SusC/RagA family TonB-linked outer membrane protein [Chitinophaga costaii]|nr:SusC/RagA family TonB-linked outer membrane protein [Chitinophaga costaii]
MQKSANWFRETIAWTKGAEPVAQPDRTTYGRVLIKMLYVMKLTCAMLLAFVIQVHASSSKAQSVTLVGQNLSLKNVFAVIEKQTGYVVFGKKELLQETLPVTVSVSGMPLTDFMKMVMKGQPLDYYLDAQTIIISAKTPAAGKASDALAGDADTTTMVQGKIINEKGDPVIGASVFLLSTHQVATTNEAGFFLFRSVPRGTYTLSVTHVSYQPQKQTLVVNSRQPIITSVVMRAGKIELQAVSISTGYQTIGKESTTGSYGVITAKELKENPSLNLLEKMNGLVPGMRVDPRNNSVQIRTFNSLTPDVTANAPLIVIDGFPALQNNLVSNPGTLLSRTSSPDKTNAILNTFNPDDIESITVLKDAAAASIWGSQAANGVIVIETKKGHRGQQPSLTASAALSVSAPPNLNQMKVMNSAEYIDMEKDLFDKGFFQDPNSYWRQPPTSEAVQLMFDAQDGKITAAQRDQELARLGAVNNKKQLTDNLLRNAVTQQYNLSVSGGGVNSNYYVSGHYAKDNPIYKYNDAQSYGLTANLNNTFLHDRVTLSTGIDYTYNNSLLNSMPQTLLTPGMQGIRPYETLFDANGQPTTKYLAFSQPVVDSFSRLGFLPWSFTPMDEINSTYTTYKTNTTRIIAGLHGIVTNWLSLDVKGSLSKYNTFMNYLQGENSYTIKDLLNTGTYNDNGKLIFGVPRGDILKTSNTISDDYSLRFQLNINKHFGEDHAFSFLAGNEFRQNRVQGYLDTYYGYDKDASNSVVVNPTTPYKTYLGTTTTLGSTDNYINQSIIRYLSYFGNATYSYKNKYFISGSARFDDYTQVGLERRKRAKPFWSGGVKWEVLKEDFMKKVTFLDQLSVRATLGTGGRVPVGGQLNSLYQYGGIDQITGLPYGSITTPGDLDLGWETTRTLNFGLDAALLHNRLRVSFDIYDKKTTDLIITASVDPTYGWTSLSYNSGNMTGHGYEGSISGDIVRNRNWTATTTFNLAYTKTEVTDSRYAPNDLTFVPGSPHILKGYPVDNLFAYRWAGLSNKGQPQIYDATGKIIPDGGTINFADLKYMGRTTPAFYGGFSQTVRYKSLQLRAMITYSLGYKIFYDPINVNNLPFNNSASGFLSDSKALVNRWRKPGDEANTNIPSLLDLTVNGKSDFAYADINVLSGSNIRLTQLALSYSFPERILKSTNVIKAMSLGMAASNLGLIWKANHAGVDPDYIFTGNYSSMKPTPNFNFNVNITL